MAGIIAPLAVALGGSILAGAIITLDILGIVCLAGNCPTDRRIRSDDLAHMLFQFNNTALTGGELRRLRGLMVRVTDEVGSAKFSSDRFQEVDGRFTVTDTNPESGILSGELSVPIPGLERDVTAEGKWVAIHPTQASQKLAQTFEDIHDAVQNADEESTEGLDRLLLSLQEVCSDPSLGLSGVAEK